MTYPHAKYLFRDQVRLFVREHFNLVCCKLCFYNFYHKLEKCKYCIDKLMDISFFDSMQTLYLQLDSLFYDCTTQGHQGWCYEHYLEFVSTVINKLLDEDIKVEEVLLAEWFSDLIIVWQQCYNAKSKGKLFLKHPGNDL